MKPKGRILGKPFVGYKGYRIWHEREGRYYVCLVPIDSDSGLKRSTITLAKYRMSKKLGRILRRDEEVDHKDGNKTNDKIDNLQVLSLRENRIKQALERGYPFKKIHRLRSRGLSYEKIKVRLQGL